MNLPAEDRRELGRLGEVASLDKVLELGELLEQRCVETRRASKVALLVQQTDGDQRVILEEVLVRQVGQRGIDLGDRLSELILKRLTADGRREFCVVEEQLASADGGRLQVCFDSGEPAVRDPHDRGAFFLRKIAGRAGSHEERHRDGGGGQ